MTIKRQVLSTAQNDPRMTPQGGCLDCTQCNGLCWSFAEMARLPDAILNTDRTPRP